MNTDLRVVYLHYVNTILPEAAKYGNYPVQYNHCWARILLDISVGCYWKDVIQSPAYKNAPVKVLVKAICYAREILEPGGEKVCREYNYRSLCYRRKIKGK